MINKTKRFFKKFIKTKDISKAGKEVFPDEIFLDSKNLPQFDQSQFEGRIEKPIPRSSLAAFLVAVSLVLVIFAGKAWSLQITNGQKFANRSENNRLKHATIFADRGLIFDRNGIPLAWNTIEEHRTGETSGDVSTTSISTSQASTAADFSIRSYIKSSGFAHILGYIKYPQKDSAGFYYQEKYDAKDGVEKFYDDFLSGKNGTKITEVNALGKIESENTIEAPKQGRSLHLTIDAWMQENLHNTIKTLAEEVGFTGGAGAIINIKTGEVLALTSYPEYDPNIMANSKDADEVKKFSESNKNPFLDRFIDGLYTPGSTVKPFLALGALSEKIISPDKQIESTGSISIQNPYDPSKKTIFKDWRVNGFTDMPHAIAVSSDVYFYEIGGGYEDQKGLGIANIEKYLRKFGFGQKIDHPFLAGKAGVIPSPVWKAETFKDDPNWRIGNTYHTAIGQYGTQISPIQLLMATAIVANKGVVPRIALTAEEVAGGAAYPTKRLDIPGSYFDVIHHGMRLGVLEGTAKALNFYGVDMAAKTGTAELGTKKEFVNSWVTGFFPYSDPRYAFTIIMEKGGSHNLVGATVAARRFFELAYNEHRF